MIYNRNNFSIASLCEGEQRYYLNGIHFTPKHSEVTNGYYLMRVSTPFSGKELEDALNDLPKVEGYEPKKENGSGEECFTFPAEACVVVERSIPKEKWAKVLNNAWITENTTKEEAEFVTHNLTTTKPVKARKIEGKWANTDAVMPEDKPEMTLGFNPEYMQKICQVFKKMKLRQVRLDIYGEKKAMRMIGKTEEGQEVIVLLMPMVTDLKAPEEKNPFRGYKEEDVFPDINEGDK